LQRHLPVYFLPYYRPVSSFQNRHYHRWDLVSLKQYDLRDMNCHVNQDHYDVLFYFLAKLSLRSQERRQQLPQQLCQAPAKLG
jgi:hypothetical protein